MDTRSKSQESAHNDNSISDASHPPPAQLPPRRVIRDRSDENRGGYDCEFVVPPPSGLQTECPVCLQILKEPCLISCCGHKFCRECIERIEKDKKPCALCNEPGFTYMRELGLERSLNDLEVWCSYRKEGCEWKEKLGKLDGHLNRNSSPDNQLNGCKFVELECMYQCGAWFQRRYITGHETQQCERRPYSCDHCQDYNSTFQDVIEVHYPQCGKYPVACPNDCDVYMFERQNLEIHLKEQCPVALVDCPFSYAGCKTQLPRRDIPEHLKRENIMHLTLLATATQKLSVENQRLVKENRELHQKLIDREQESAKTVAEVRMSLYELNTKWKSIVEENRQLRSELSAERKAVKEAVHVSSKLDEKYSQQLHNQEIKQREMDRSLWELKTKFKSVAEGNQQLCSNISVEREALKGDVHTSLHKLDEKFGQLLYSQDFKQHKMRQDISSLEKRLHEYQQKECPLQTLHAAQSKAMNEKFQEIVKVQQITEGILKEEVQKQKLEVQELLHSPGFPVDYHVKRSIEREFLPPFYTHPHGYRMCICVYTNGDGTGKRTHISIYACMMQGPFDEYLKWPFEGEVTVQIVNQVGDHGHVEEIIPYTAKKSDEKQFPSRPLHPYRRGTHISYSGPANLRGCDKFLAHGSLLYNAERKTQYLKGDTLHIRVVKVTLN